jgi:hypothetical protein
MVQSAENWSRKNAPDGITRDTGASLFQGEVGPRASVVRHIQEEYVAQVPLAEDDEMVKTFPPDRANQPFRCPASAPVRQF